MEMAWCSVSDRWEALVIHGGRTVGYGQGVTRAQAVERAIQDALRHGHAPSLATSYLVWGAAIVQDARDYVRRTIREMVEVML